MNTELILTKLQSLSRCTSRIESKMNPKFYEDIDSQDVVLLNLQRAIQLSIDLGAILLKELNIEIPNSRSEIFQKLFEQNIITFELATTMSRSVGFRNLAVHEYSRVDLEKVFYLSKSELHIFFEFGKAVIEFVEKKK
jgi:uncharacterized protein YutE (UPF0331/DUF86 family)